MICKIMDTKNDGIKKIGRYIIWDKGGKENISNVKVHNSTYDVSDIDIAISDMAANNFRCTTSKRPTVYHFVISLPRGETLTNDQFDYAEKKFIDAFGLSECQRLSATHSGTKNLHRHVVVATASCEDRKNIRPRFDKAASIRTSRELEKEFGISVDAGTSRNSELYDEYCIERDSTKIIRSEMLEQLKVKHRKHTNGLKDLYDDVIDKTMTMPWSRNRKTFLEYVRHDREMSRLARQARQKAEREAIYSEFRPRTWADFLRHKAAEGHQEAIRVLRKRQRAPQQPDLQVAPENHHPEVEKDRDSAEASR
ncbi:Endonuclease relaxase, MobA/VirD2 [uncultured Caudovirales phage]|uniref:Endonuclease relaxase, MobA/VirD2 n=1 Tax=uncultured Caudovirales phage TaxID=2100421 RepID=A0A6J5RFA3_9CAUD|nr:Endonuclease relaxase, MobA/VirD2 [uncultured Caudovirales phage]